MARGVLYPGIRGRPGVVIETGARSYAHALGGFVHETASSPGGLSLVVGMASGLDWSGATAVSAPATIEAACQVAPAALLSSDRLVVAMRTEFLAAERLVGLAHADVPHAAVDRILDRTAEGAAAFLADQQRIVALAPESLAGVRRGVGLPLDWLGLVAISRVIVPPLAWDASVRTRAPMQMETLTGTQRAITSRIGWDAAVGTAICLPVTWRSDVTVLAVTTRLPLDWLHTTRCADILPTDWTLVFAAAVRRLLRAQADRRLLLALPDRRQLATIAEARRLNAREGT